MDVVDLAEQATTLLEAYRSILLLDPFLRITVEVAETDGISQCVIDSAPLSWKIVFNPKRHQDSSDIQYSVIEALLYILMEGLTNDGNKAEVAAVVSRLTTSIANMTGSEEEVDEDY